MAKKAKALDAALEWLRNGHPANVGDAKAAVLAAVEDIAVEAMDEVDPGHDDYHRTVARRLVRGKDEAE